MTITLTRLRPLVAAGVASALLAGGATAASAAEPSVVLDHGHIDAFAVFYEDDQLKVELQEDVTGSDVRHAPEDVLLQVKPEAAMALPDPVPANLSFLEPHAGETVYFLPQTQDQALIWPGWSTEALPAGVFTSPIDIEVLTVEGPGEAYLWQSGSFGQTIPVLEGGGQQLPGVIPTNVNAHVHSNWVFTQPGRYELSVRASAELTAGGTVTSETRTYSFQVGEAQEVPPVETTLSVTGGDGHYHVGDDVTLTAVQDPQTELDHYHWFTRTSPDAEWQIVPGVGGGEYAFTIAAEHENLQVIARLYGEDHSVVAESAPVSLDVHVGGGEEPVETTLSVTGGDGHYHVGDDVTLTAVQDPQTELDHYHWFTRTSPDAEWQIVPGVGGGEYAFTIAAEHENLQVIARLYGEDHSVVAESAPVSLDVHVGGGEEPEPVEFTDVAKNHVFIDEIGWLADTGITTGYLDGTFRPSQPVLREQMAAFLYRLETLLTGSAPEVELPAGGSPFKDVATSHAFYKEIVWLESTGITTGYSDGTFRPSQPVLREQMAAFLYRFGEEDYVDDGKRRFTDVAVSHAFFDEIEWLAATEITTGYSDGTFRGPQPVLREQMAAFLYRYDQLVQSEPIE